MARYLDPKTDLTFKKIFGDHPDLLISFLNAVMPFEKGRRIVTLEYLPSELIPQQGKKLSIVDVRCVDNFDRQFIVEMQTEWTVEFMNRIYFNSCKAYVKPLLKGERYRQLNAVYTLVILNDVFDRVTELFYHHFKMVNVENTVEVLKGAEIVIFEIPKFQPEKFSSRKLAVLWLRFLKEVDESMKSLPPEMLANEYIRTAVELCEESAFTEEELAAYNGYWDVVRTEKALMEKRREEGIEEGRKEGIEEGMEKGTEKVVLNCHKAKMPIETISLVTNLTPEQITEILKRHELI